MRLSSVNRRAKEYEYSGEGTHWMRRMIAAERRGHIIKISANEQAREKGEAFLLRLHEEMGRNGDLLPKV